MPPLPPTRMSGPEPAIPWRRLGLLMLPLRLLFGVTFVYAGLDKLLDPRPPTPRGPTLGRS